MGITSRGKYLHRRSVTSRNLIDSQIIKLNIMANIKKPTCVLKVEFPF